MTNNIAGVTPVDVSSTTSTPVTHKTELDSGAFLQLMLSQLKNQNPLDPMNDKDFMAQMTQMNSLQEQQKMNKTLTQLANSSSMSQAANLIGRNIEANMPDGTTTSGLVTSVTLQDGAVTLMLGDKPVPFSDLLSVSAGEKAAAEKTPNA